MTHARRIDMHKEAIKLAEMLDGYLKLHMGMSDNIRAEREKEFIERRTDFQIKYDTDFVDVLENKPARARS